jgi:hypothetical protein
MNELLDLIGNLRECAWSHWAPATLKFCEAHLCERIVAPVETWSNAAYFVVSAILIGRASRSPSRRGFDDIDFRFGVYALIVGVCSSLFHASYTYAFETADLASMNLLGVELVLQGMKRLGWTRGQSPVALGAILFIGAFLLLLGTKGNDRLAIFGGFVALVLWFEAILFLRGRRMEDGRDYRYFVWSLGLLATASAFWILDYTGLVCDPDRHWFSGHAAWHVLNSGCFLTLSRFYRPS